ncbi:hypothetical protein SSPS47_19385 [Streptomyces sp. S4.7]|nr:hypothetical protein SSPS47_19385 [Streptomyces sp. S4.7]
MTVRPPAPARSGARWADAAWCAVRFGRPGGRGRGPVSRPVSVLWRPVGGAGAPASVPCHTLARLDGAFEGPREPYACDVHLRVDPDASERRDTVWYADVLVVREPLTTTAARRRATELIARYPGSLVAAVPDSSHGCVLAVRDGADVWADRRRLPANLAGAGPARPQHGVRPRGEVRRGSLDGA